MNVKQKIISRIFDNPSRKFYIRELAREIHVNPNSVLNALEELEKESLVKREVKKHIVEITPNLENPHFLAKKRLHNLEKVYDSGVIDFLRKHYNPKAIILFGSYSRGEDVLKSDIDIAVVTSEKYSVSTKIFEKMLNRGIHILLVQNGKIPKELYTNLINGVVLFGYLDYETF
ncbi:MAG TPA: nucleotidyltransferase domain-containing protein [Candidatus Nanoarchaeia archaeon]|nr:nucleotidyltransferase domain-containing protein [Candidatus Nanoarchaeia archaeon]